MSHIQNEFASLFRPLIKAPPSAGLERVRKKYHELRSRIIDERLAEILDQLFKTLSTSRNERLSEPPALVAERIPYLLERGMHGVAEIVFILNADAFPKDAVAEVLDLAPSSEALDKWVKASKINRKSLLAQLLAEPVRTYPRATLEWVFDTEAPKNLATLLGMLLRGEPRPPHLRTPPQFIAQLLEGDTRGAWLDAILSQVSESTSIALILQHFRQSPDALDRVLRNLPSRIDNRKLGHTAQALAQAIFTTLPHSTGPERQTGCAQLARFLSEILLLPSPGTNSKLLLKNLEAISRALQTTASSRELREFTWVLEKLGEGEVSSTTGVGVNLYGARHLIQALRQVRRGIPPVPVLEALAENVGLEPIGEPESIATYNPAIHEDSVGGLLPGDEVVCTVRGWRFDKEVLLRSEVHPSPAS